MRVHCSRVLVSFGLVIGLVTAGGAAALPASAATGGPLPSIAAIAGSGAAVDPGTLVPVAPFRALDTRASRAVAADSSVSFQAGGVAGIPANVSAVVFNLTVTEAKSFGFITAYGSGSARPNASNVNFSTGQTVPNSVTVPVGKDGKVTLFNRSAGSTQLIADISGYYLAGEAQVPGAFSAIAPTRMLDTRSSEPVGADAAVSFRVGGTSGIPANAAAVVLNLTVTSPKSYGFITAYASGTLRPNASNVNFSTDQTVPNSVTVPVGKDGMVTLYNRSSGSTELIADVSGYFLAGKVAAAGAFTPLNPTRMLDTRSTKAVAADSAVSFQVGGHSGIPADASAVVFNLTATQAKSFGFITAYASGSSKPNASNVNYATAQTIPNSVTVPVGADGKVTLFNRSTGSVQLLADIAGYYQAGTATGSVLTWGSNVVGQLGNGTTTGSMTPARVQGLEGVIDIIGYATKTALLNDGTVVTWGENYHGQLGTGSNAQYSTTPVKVTGLSGVKAIFGGNGLTYALLNDGTVRAWGSNGHGQLGNGTTIGSRVPVQIHGLNNVTEIVVAGQTSLALLSDGTVRSWGGWSALGNGQDRDSFTPVTVKGLTNVKALAGGGGFGTGYAVLNDGTVRSWGWNISGELGNGTNSNSNVPVEVVGLSGITEIATSQMSAFALGSDGTVSSWGGNYGGQLGNGTTIDSNIPVKIVGLSGVKELATNGVGGFALLQDGTVRSWGSNFAGGLGNGSSTDSSTVPVAVRGLSNVAKIIPTGNSAFAVIKDGSVRAWGYNSAGELGIGTTTDISVPVDVPGLRGITRFQSSF